MKTPMEYFDPEFDPRKETIASLSSILSNHGIELPNSRQKKQFYVDLFVDELVPKAQEIMSEIENVKPSNQGIIFVKPKSKIPISKSPLRSTHLGQEVNTQRPKDPLQKMVIEIPRVDFNDLKKRFESLQSRPATPRPKPAADSKRKMDMRIQEMNEQGKDTRTPERPTNIPKRAKTSPEIQFPPNNLKFKRPVTPLQIKKQRFLDQVERVEGHEPILAPKRGRFMILPVLPGVRSKIPSEGSVRDMATRYDTVIKSPITTQSNMDSTLEQTNCTERAIQAEDWEEKVPTVQRVKKESRVTLLFLLFVGFSSLFWVFGTPYLMEFADWFLQQIHSRYPVMYGTVEDIGFLAFYKYKEIIDPLFEKFEHYWWSFEPVFSGAFKSCISFIRFAKIEILTISNHYYNVLNPIADVKVKDFTPIVSGIANEVYYSLKKSNEFYYAMAIHFVNQNQVGNWKDWLSRAMEQVVEFDVASLKPFFVTIAEKLFPFTTDFIRKGGILSFCAEMTTHFEELMTSAENGELNDIAKQNLLKLNSKLMENQTLCVGIVVFVTVTVAFTYGILSIFQ
jgi:hypothetical protein